MSLVTTCPACATTFRVTPEQLSAHRGDVRCGQCQHIFNALRQLEEVMPVAVQESTEVVATEIENAPSVPVDPSDLQPAEPQPESSEQPVPENEDALADNLLPADGVVDFELDFDGDVEPDTPQPEPETESEASVETETTATASVAEPAIPESAVHEPAAPEPTPKPQPAAVVPSFMQPKKKRGVSFWVLLPIALLLLATAIAQSAYFMRTQIAAHYPHLRPWLEQACARIGCTVELPHQADLLSIEDSDLQDDAEHAGVLVLVSALYNHAPYPQAYPLLELTLTDTYDKPVLRRTFSPHEYLPAGTDIMSGIAADGEIRSRLPLTVEGEKPAGYRLYVRY